MFKLLEQFGVNYDVVKELFEERVNDESYDEIKSETPFDDDSLKVLILMISNPKKNKPTTKSKTPVLNNFGRDLTLLAEEDKLDPVIGEKRNRASFSSFIT